ncbi:MAG: nucleoside hydrolase [Prolixibacteraceae bacterium]|nr:nucleoside hydrolase [Prolixibacteraceae bacterium]
MNRTITLLALLSFFYGCTNSEKKQSSKTQSEKNKIKILVDTDANNELDDQHALAYAFLSDDVFNVVGITVNNTINGEGIQGHYDEALRIIRLFNLEETMPLKKGAVGIYKDIAPHISEADFDGHEAVDFIIEQAGKNTGDKLVLIPVGKLTNIALALLKAPEIKEKIRVVWLGSNYPGEGEYNLENDTTSVNPVIESGVEFEMVTVRYGFSSGTAAVTVSPEEIRENVMGKGPVAKTPITGRHGGEFARFGDYSMNLFEHINQHGELTSRALFDMAAVATVKNPEWAEKVEIPAPRLSGVEWIVQPDNQVKISYWENFNRDAIVNDFFQLLNR